MMRGTRERRHQLAQTPGMLLRNVGVPALFPGDLIVGFNRISLLQLIHLMPK